MADRRLPTAPTRARLRILLATVAAFALWAVPTAADAADTASSPDGTITLVAGLQYSRLAPDETQEPWRDYAPRESEEEGDPSVAVAPDGTATVVWTRVGPLGTAILERRIDPEGELEGAIHELGHSDDSHTYPEVVVAPDGTATATWTATSEGEDSVVVSRIAPDGTPDSVPTEVTTFAAYTPSIGVAPDGTVTVAWEQFGENRAVAEARQVAPDGTLGEVLKLSSGIGSAQEPRLAVTPTGAVVLAWEDIYWNAEPDEVLEERRIEADGTLEAAVHTISTESGARAPVLAAAPDGAVAVLWSQSFHHLLERRIEADGTPAKSIYDVAAPAVDGIFPEVAFEPDGKAAVTWGDGWNVFFRHLGSDGAPLGSPTHVLASNGYISIFGMGLGPGGVATPIWQRRLGYYKAPYEWVTQAARIQSDDSVGPIFDLTGRGTEAATWAAPASGEYGAVAVGSQRTLSFAFNNRSTDPMPVESVELGGPDADQFSVVDTGTCLSAPIPFVKSCTVTVGFDPASAGPKEAELILAADAPRLPQTVPLTGSGVATSLPSCCQRQEPSPPPPPPLRFSVGKAESGHGAGAAVLPVSASRTGSLQVSVTCPTAHPNFEDQAQTSVRLDPDEQVDVTARATGPCRASLRRRGAVKLAVALRFQPDEGQPVERSRQLLLSKRR